jgi:UDP-N-acetylglucosamine 2-epimerase
MAKGQQPLMLVLGIRPDVIRASLMIRMLREQLGENFVFVWSGQHYSDNLKDIFFRQLDVGAPDYELSANGNSEPEFIGNWISALGNLIEQVQPVATAFLGDTNTVLGTLACASHNVPIAHIEGCMRSYDWRMPEEKFRTVADHLSDVIYAYLDEYKDQGVLEGLDPRQIVVTGNPIVDVLEYYFLSGRIRLTKDDFASLRSSVQIDEGFAVMTCHRRENVENPSSLGQILKLARETNRPVIFPASYRTQRSIQKFGLTVPGNVKIIDPIGYIELLELISASDFVLTDSGTVVEETAVLQVPSIQMRSSTERPQVYDSGSSIKFDPHLENSQAEMRGVIAAAESRKGSQWSHGLGDGKSSARIVQDLVKRCENPAEFRGHSPFGTNRPFNRNLGVGLSMLGDWKTSL